jgi:hypothetical protein
VIITDLLSFVSVTLHSSFPLSLVDIFSIHEWEGTAKDPLHVQILLHVEILLQSLPCFSPNLTNERRLCDATVALKTKSLIPIESTIWHNTCLCNCVFLSCTHILFFIQI